MIHQPLKLGSIFEHFQLRCVLCPLISFNSLSNLVFPWSRSVSTHLCCAWKPWYPQIVLNITKVSCKISPILLCILYWNVWKCSRSVRECGHVWKLFCLTWEDMGISGAFSSSNRDSGLPSVLRKLRIFDRKLLTSSRTKQSSQKSILVAFSFETLLWADKDLDDQPASLGEALYYSTTFCLTGLGFSYWTKVFIRRDRLMYLLRYVVNCDGLLCKYTSLSDPYFLLCSPSGLSLSVRMSWNGIKIETRYHLEAMHWRSQHYYLQTNFSNMTKPAGRSRARQILCTWEKPERRKWRSSGMDLVTSRTPGETSETLHDVMEKQRNVLLTYLCLLINVNWWKMRLQGSLRCRMQCTPIAWPPWTPET